jgi:hypothetical protein
MRSNLSWKKYTPPCWNIGSDKYSAADFKSQVLPVVHPFFLETDFSVTDTCIVYGPYVRLPSGEQEASFHVRAIGLGDQELGSPITFDVARDMNRITSVEVVGIEGSHLIQSERVVVRSVITLWRRFSNFAYSHQVGPSLARLYSLVYHCGVYSCLAGCCS